MRSSAAPAHIKKNSKVPAARVNWDVHQKELLTLVRRHETADWNPGRTAGNVLQLNLELDWLHTKRQLIIFEKNFLHSRFWAIESGTRPRVPSKYILDELDRFQFFCVID